MSNSTHLAYLLRLWQDSEEGSWRATLDTTYPGERILFATLTELVVYLEYRTGEQVCGEKLGGGSAREQNDWDG